MARKPIQRSLPPLAEQLPAFKGFAPAENKSRGLEKALRGVASRNRRARAQPFYSMREVSAFFGVTLPSVGKVYRQLEREGLLVRKRSSVTELAPLKTGRPVVHRGIVAVPIWLPGFLMFSDWREFFIELEQQLRRHNFVANLIFFRQGEDESPDFAQRVLGHEPESMVRLAPIPTMAFQMICEAGVRPVVLGNMPGQLLPGQRYFLSWNRGLQQCLAAWKKAGIRTVTIPRADPAPFTSATHAGERLIREAGLDCRIARPGGADWANYLDKLGRFDGEAVMFDEDIWQSRLCAQAPRAVAGLIRRVPVMVLRHLNVAAPDLAGAHVDWLGHDMRAIARRVAHDLDTGAAFSPGTPTVFEAEWNPHVPAEGRAAPFGFD